MQLNLKILALGDGYNDTQMLQAADCGIRIDNGGNKAQSV